LSVAGQIQNGERFEFDRRDVLFSLSFMAFDEYSKYLVFVVVLLFVRHLEFLPMPFYSAPSFSKTSMENSFFYIKELRNGTVLLLLLNHIFNKILDRDFFSSLLFVK